MNGTETEKAVKGFRENLLAELKAMPDVAEALSALPTGPARVRYLEAVLARVAHNGNKLMAAALGLALTFTPAAELAPVLSPRPGIVISRHFNEKRRPESIERDGAPFEVPSAVANLLRDAMENDEIDADRRIVEQMHQLLPELRGLLVMDENRKGDKKRRSVFNINLAMRGRITVK